MRNWQVVLLAACLTLPIACVAAQPQIRLQARPLPWYMRETAMTRDGRLTFLNKPWWPRAKRLAEGGSFTLDLNHDGRPDTLITRRDGNIIEAIDDSGHAANIWNKADTAYVVSYHGTGIVDRMVVYTDNHHDGKADEMEIRYYKSGYLRYAWFGENYDNDSAQIFHLTNWQYDGKQFQSKFRGNVMIYLNKYNPQTQSWTPLSECPFAFWDPNHDGLGEIVFRAATAPVESIKGNDLDYANNYQYAWQAQPLPLKDMAIVNGRLSFNIDPEPRHSALDRPHYNFGFNMVGDQPYRFPHMFYTNPRRRPPQTVVRLDWHHALAVALAYPANQTGFSWDEARGVHRWEGDFWINERRVMPNTGGPTMRWNVRREFSGKLSQHRQLYYSGVDKRYHLYGASESWLEVGHLVDSKKDLEIRAFDTNHDGYFDTWEIFEPGRAGPVRVSRVLNPAARLVPLTRKFLIADYNQRVLPEAIAGDEQLIAEMKKFVSSPLAREYEQAAIKSAAAERRRYCLDVARELYFLGTRDALYRKNASGDYPSLPQEAYLHPFNLLKRGPVDGRYTIGDTLAYWKLALKIQAFVDDYGNGRLRRARADLAQIAAPAAPAPTTP
ncbi:MAG: hypothetical protein ACRD11_04890 [Terriglobia bacterium]